jgi:hypothetical protein
MPAPVISGVTCTATPGDAGARARLSGAPAAQVGDPHSNAADRLAALASDTRHEALMQLSELSIASPDARELEMSQDA